MAAKSILYIEDDELDVICFERALLKFNIPIVFYTAYNGIEAFELLEGKNKISIPDIIVLDLSMPKMNGFEFLKRMRKNSKYDLVRIFIMTTSNDDKDRIEAEYFNIDGYIIKPLNFNENTKRNSSMDNFMHFQINKMLGKDISRLQD
ncbi:response regulator containing a CheY-like receiver domain and an HTH DNA-binding domain [Sporocytophaga myxococcoides]|uniref:Response regulator containing a CheY-like receiver domain and an HTH DNA-binding domain n=1 Tax=Sporocytophaga myxococcoides TaxID=153721 RepID=A0A098LHH9_9BACT|nr:response regulator [Sporocytophaga myxococcoides]GAL85899.1 response regulator containing a CheY-like receiver domain and an HTH DNA-binding domain [Sporocytophaga myxococcoides]